MSEVDVRTVAYGSDGCRQMLLLREEVLRSPLGLELSAEDKSGEDAQFHIGAYEGDQLVGCVVLKPVDAGTVQLRQMAVAEPQRGQGVGRMLLEKAESVAAQNGFREIVLHARKTAVGFYLRHGYEVTGGEYISVTIPHLDMRKIISS